MTDWRDRAACRDTDPDAFFDDNRTAEAKDICVACPVRLICLDWAHDTNVKDGIWGGLTPRERDREKRQRPKRPARCAMCGSHYTPTGRGQRYCGKPCQLAAQRKRQNAWDQNHRAERRAYKNRRKQEAAA